MSEDAAQGAQPAGDGGQGDQGPDQSGSPFASVLEAAPNDRESVQAALRDVEGKITQRFQEAAEFRKSWEPFAEMGLSDMGPENTAQAVGLYQLFTNPDSIDPEMVGEGFENAWAQIGEKLGYFDPEDGGASDQDGQQVQGEDQMPAWAQELSQQVQAVQQHIQQGEATQQAQQHDQQLNEQLDGLKGEYGDEWDDVQTDILALAHVFAAGGASLEESISQANARYQAIRGAGEKGLIEDKLAQPVAAENGGQAAGRVEKPRDWREAEQIARRRLAA